MFIMYLFQLPMAALTLKRNKGIFSKTCENSDLESEFSEFKNSKLYDD